MRGPRAAPGRDAAARDDGDDKPARARDLAPLEEPGMQHVHILRATPEVHAD